MAAAAGLDGPAIERVAAGPDGEGWTERQRLILSATDELLGTGAIAPATWNALRAHYDEPRLIELCMLVGHYEMLAKTINTLEIRPDEPRPRRLRWGAA
jgi:alkylhydroperoxidase family enzyme